MNHEGTAKPEAMMMEKAVSPMNWEAALYAVERNDGASGPDGMSAKELRAHLEKNGRTIKERLLEGSYRPSAARRKEIAKPDGGMRPLSIPNVQDRFVQHLLLGVLQPVFEPQFSESSYGFRPMRSTHDAVKAAKAHAETGHTYVVDMDITKFFDRVNHDILMSKIGKVVRDKRVLQIIGRFLRAGVVMPDGLAVSSEEGTPQGGPLSPLLANIYLDALDKELEKRGLRFARYADDCNIYVSSRKAAERAKENITEWLKRKLKLQVNESKSGVGRPWERKFLGFTFTVALLITIASSSLVKYKDRVRELWEARQSKSSTELRNQWVKYVQGWWGYYRLSEWRRPIFDTEGWARRRIRCCFWQRWHNSAGRQNALRKMGVPADRAKMGSSSKGAWAMAKHAVMNEALSNKVLKKWKFWMPSQLGK